MCGYTYITDDIGWIFRNAVA